MRGKGAGVSRGAKGEAGTREAGGARAAKAARRMAPESPEAERERPRRKGANGAKGERARRAPYVRRLQRRGPLDVWLVDGSYVRTNVDEEFSNFGHHYSFSEIPKTEIWLDVEGDEDERKFFIAHAVLERRLMAKGKSYDQARKAANKLERALRVKAGDLRKVRKREKSLPQAELVHSRIWKKLPTGVTVWFVQGRLVRSAFDVEFTEGGHEHVYEYVPRDEVWIDDDIHEDELGFVLFHELYERNLMANGMDYDTAHQHASEREAYLRQHPTELHEALAEQGWE